jgi:hypothetical protein
MLYNFCFELVRFVVDRRNIFLDKLKRLQEPYHVDLRVAVHYFFVLFFIWSSFRIGSGYELTRNMRAEWNKLFRIHSTFCNAPSSVGDP